MSLQAAMGGWKAKYGYTGGEWGLGVLKGPWDTDKKKAKSRRRGQFLCSIGIASQLLCFRNNRRLRPLKGHFPCLTPITPSQSPGASHPSPSSASKLWTWPFLTIWTLLNIFEQFWTFLTNFGHLWTLDWQKMLYTTRRWLIFSSTDTLDVSSDRNDHHYN